MSNDSLKQLSSSKPVRLAFLGVGWIGRSRMEAMLASECVEAVAIADHSREMMACASAAAPSASCVLSFDELLAYDVDGLVIATPNAQHVEQATRALAAGRAVFCQKPLGRSAAEVKAVVAAAKAADRRLGVDLSYRCTSAMRHIKALIDAGELGDIMAIDLTFHNAYGPDKPWFYDRAQSGGGCVIDLGVHLVDLALWVLDFPEVVDVSSCLMAQGKPISRIHDQVEDFAVATLQLSNGTVVRLACSWRLNAGYDCVIDASFYGSKGGAAMRNLAGSYYELTADRFIATKQHRLCSPPDDWGGRAALEWAEHLASDRAYDPAAEQFVAVSQVIDLIYSNHSSASLKTS